MEEELIRSNALRAFIVGYLLGLTWDAISTVADVADNENAARLTERLKELYPLIEKEFYSGVAKNVPQGTED
jgi:hypothetical protein